MSLLKFCIFAGASFLLSFPGWADEKAVTPETCEAVLAKKEFARTPDDERDGLVTDRVPLNVESLKAAYAQGLFPWGISEMGAKWYNPKARGILQFGEMHDKISARDLQFIRNAHRYGFRVSYNEAFDRVIRECAAMPRFKRDPLTGERRAEGTWISEDIINNFTALHRAGFAHSVEVWKVGADQREELVAGMYGVFVEGVFAGESMFHLVDEEGRALPDSSNATKLGLYSLIQRLEKNGHTFMDTQQALGLIAKWGGKLIPRDTFLARLKTEQAKDLPF